MRKLKEAFLAYFCQPLLRHCRINSSNVKHIEAIGFGEFTATIQAPNAAGYCPANAENRHEKQHDH
jgi:hypothetical protein